MSESPDDQELLDELAPFLQSARGKEDQATIPPEDLTRRILSEHLSTESTAASPLDSLPRPFGPYELRTVLGRGGSATVYGGFDPELQRGIAIKILAPELAAIDTARERFLREARAAAQLHHDHIMPIFAVHQDTPLPCLTMPLLDGRTLQERISLEGALPAGELARIGSELAAALQTAHENGYIHRDVKPSNVFLEAGSGRVRLMDFGLAKTADALDLTLPGILAGTPEFLAPEQLDGADPTPRSDLYGLGATLYAMAAGEPPFTGTSVYSVLKKSAIEAAPALPPEVPKSVRSFIADLLEKDPAKRPPSAAKIRSTLDGIRLSGDTLPRRSWRSFAMVGTAAIALLALLAWWIKTSHEKKYPRSEGQAEVVEVSDLAELREALLRDSPQTATIRITTPGAYPLPPLDLGARHITLEAGQPGVHLSWDSTTEPAIRTRGRLALRNLSLTQKVLSRSGSVSPFIEFHGPTLAIESCHLEQPHNSNQNIGQESFVTLHSAARMTVARSRVLLFRSSFIGCDNPGAEVMIEESLTFVPRLFVTPGGGTLRAKGCSLTTHFIIYSGGGPEAATVAPERCYLQARYAHLWLPGVGSGEEADRRIDWRGRDNVYSSRWVFLFSETMTPGRRATTMKPRGFHWPAFSDWVSHWGTRDEAARRWPTALVSPAGMAGPVTTEALLDEFRNVYREGFGVDPARTGPFAK